MSFSLRPTSCENGGRRTADGGRRTTDDGRLKTDDSWWKNPKCVSTFGIFFTLSLNGKQTFSFLRIVYSTLQMGAAQVVVFVCPRIKIRSCLFVDMLKKVCESETRIQMNLKKKINFHVNEKA
ncbi:MAG TPA: hypothetical protein ENJ53_03750 [Phaeodactylibacter sp.]|nr:hypothetical protein [Phaeodactylibacter sp.]